MCSLFLTIKSQSQKENSSVTRKAWAISIEQLRAFGTPSHHNATTSPVCHSNAALVQWYSSSEASFQNTCCTVYFKTDSGEQNVRRYSRCSSSSPTTPFFRIPRYHTIGQIENKNCLSCLIPVFLGLLQHCRRSLS